MILLSLVGEQPIPNLLPLWQFSQFNAVQFAATKTTEPHARVLEQAVAHDQQLQRLEIYPALTLEAYHLGKARQTLARAISDWQAKGEKLCINFTGGTKIMSLAALQAAYGTGVPLMYVSSEENQVIFYQSDGAETERLPLQVAISVQQYLEACGLEILTVNPHAAPPPKDGDWLEEKVYKAALDAGIFDSVARGVHVARQIRSGEKVKNELDVLVTRNGRLAVCSCKTGKKITNEAFYELAALSSRENLGIYCGKVLAASSHELPPGLNERARSNRIYLVDHLQLDKVAYYLKLATD